MARRGAERNGLDWIGRKEGRGKDGSGLDGIGPKRHYQLNKEAPMKPKSKTVETIVDIVDIKHGQITVCILGSSPLIYNAMSNKVRQDLLLPPTKKNNAEKASSLKHNPYKEFVNSMYRFTGGSAPTRLYAKGSWFKNNIMGAALDLPGSTKAQIGRLVQVTGDQIPIYGIPQLHMSVVRQAGIQRAPDIRTRAILPQWACMFDVKFLTPIIKAPTIINLLVAAGLCQGIGDYRAEKGHGNYGSYELTDMDDKIFRDTVETGTRAAQDAAIANPTSYDCETQSLLEWWTSETEKRGFTDQITKTTTE